MTDKSNSSSAALAAFLAKGGKITRCPSASAEDVANASARAWEEQQATYRTGLTQRERRIAAEERTDRQLAE